MISQNYSVDTPSAKQNTALIDYFGDLPTHALPQVHREQHGDFCHSASS